MIEVNVTGLKSDIKAISDLIEEQEETKLNLFNELKDSCNVNWNDRNSYLFDKEIQLDSVETEKIINNLKQKRDLYDFIYQKYSELGNYVKCNLNNESILAQSMESSTTELEGIVGELSSSLVDLTFLQRDILSAINSLEVFKIKVGSALQNIKGYEAAISAKINAIEIVKINEPNFNINMEIGE